MFWRCDTCGESGEVSVARAMFGRAPACACDRAAEAQGAPGSCEHAAACLHLRRAGGHSLDGVEVVREPCQLPLCKACDAWLEVMLAKRRTARESTEKGKP